MCELVYLYNYYDCNFYIYIYSSASNDLPPLFNPPETKAHEYVLIEFHCLLSAVQWGFDSSSSVYLRFSSPQLGDFRYFYGPMIKKRRFANHFFVFILLRM